MEVNNSIMTRKISELQKNDRERYNYLKSKGAAKTFIRNKATEEDLIYLEKFIERRRKEMKNKFHISYIKELGYCGIIKNNNEK